MKVKELLVILTNADPEATVVITGDDHSYRKCYTHSAIARLNGGDLYEDYEGKLEKHESRIPVLVIN